MRRETVEPPYRRRAASAANLDAPFDTNHTHSSSSRPLSQQSKHSRASSDMSAIRGFSSATHNPDQYRARSPRVVFPSASEIFGADIEEEPTNPNEASSSPTTLTPTTSSTTFSSYYGRRAPNIRLNSVTSTDSFLDMDESDGEAPHPPSSHSHQHSQSSHSHLSSHRGSEDVPILQRDGDTISDLEFDRASRRSGSSNGGRSLGGGGVPFDELVDRLLVLRMTKSQHNFANIFLCLYRKFAAPGELFTAIRARLDRVRDDRKLHYLTKTATQLRIIDVVVRWVSLYPGDFARPTTRRNLRDFVRHISIEPIFAVAAQQIQSCLTTRVVDDDDTGWERSDDATDVEADADLAHDSSDFFSGISTLRLEEDDRMPSSHGLDLEIHDPSSLSAISGIQCHYNSVEEYERAASKLIPSEQLPMNKARYHQFMDITNEDIIGEMTRIDWIMFSSIRIRDFVRYVSLSTEEKAKSKSLKNVQRIISHFNHTARWVANMILLRDKPKHRAQIFEKFIDIAHKLRAHNNYNGLAAVLAGLNSTSIHRLAQTKALLSPEAQKQLAKLTLLMATQKSHFAYRLAWENSPLPRIPFIPLHLRDLVSAEEGNTTLVSAEAGTSSSTPTTTAGAASMLVNWSKFEVLGEVLLPIMRSQGMEYGNLRRNEMARELILDCKMPTDEDEIYARSIQVESASANAAFPMENAKKKFPWFAK